MDKVTENSEYEKLNEFLKPDCEERLFRVATDHPARPTGFCHCDHSILSTVRVCVRGACLQWLCQFPFNRPKLSLLRFFGARIGNPVHIAAAVWIDPLYPQLLTIEDEVFIGMGARIAFHEFRRDEFRAGRVILRNGAFIGSGAVITCGVEVGRNATVAAGAVVAKDVPADHTAIGNPARIVPTPAANEETSDG